jgi:hypothetical protein
MSIAEVLLSLLPLVTALALGLLVIWKAGVFQQRAHRQRVEALLERIATAVESKSKV